MLLLPTEHLAIALCPNQIGIVRRSAGLRRRQRIQVELPVTMNDTGWRQALETLACWFADEKVKAVSATVTISNSWVRFALSPWSAAVGSEAEEIALARACLESSHGDLTGWTVVLGPSRYGQSRMVCAMETALLDRLHGILREHRIACRGVHPYFMLASREGRSLLSGTNGILAVAESNAVVLASVRKGRWFSLRNVRCKLSPATLTQLLEREALLQGFTETPSLCALVPGMAQTKMPNVTLLKPQILPSSAARAMALAAAESPARMAVNFMPKSFSTGKIIGLMIFLIALGIATWSGWNYLQLQQQMIAWRAETQSLPRNETQHRVSSAPEELERVRSELRFANHVIEKLDTPWDALFGAVESTFNEQVTLLSVEPDTERREIRLLAEAKDLESMLDYVRQVRESSVLKNGYLVEHQINQQDPLRPVRFTVTANWDSHSPVEAPLSDLAVLAEEVKP